MRKWLWPLAAWEMGYRLIGYVQGRPANPNEERMARALDKQGIKYEFKPELHNAKRPQ